MTCINQIIINFPYLPIQNKVILSLFIYINTFYFSCSNLKLHFTPFSDDIKCFTPCKQTRSTVKKTVYFTRCLNRFNHLENAEKIYFLHITQPSSTN